MSAATLAAAAGRLHTHPVACDTRLAAEAITVRIQALIKGASHGSAVVERLLVKSYGGLIGAVVLAGQERFIAWVTPDCSAFLVGALFRADGQNATAAALSEAGIRPADPRSEGPTQAGSPAGARRAAAGSLLQDASKARGIMEGSRGPVVHVFVDLNCTFCSILYSQMRPLLDEGRVRVHWIPVAVLADSSRLQAAGVLEARSPAAALAEHQERRSAGRDGLPGKRPSRSTEQALAANNDLLRRVNDGLAATPVLLFGGRDGQTMHQAGALRASVDLLAQLSPSD
jgi:thiol:disulfide interchange protein DsbG